MWLLNGIKEKRKKKNIQKFRGIVKNWKINFNYADENTIKFYYVCDVELESEKITKENFILIEPNIEISFLKYLRNTLNLN